MARYVTTRPKAEIDISKIVTVHNDEYGPDFAFEGERHDFWEMVYVDKGSVEITRDGESVALKQGQMIFHKPNEFHTIRSLESSPNFFVISFVSPSPAMARFERMVIELSRAQKNLLGEIIGEAERCYFIPKNTPDLRRLVRRPDAPLGSEQLIKIYLEQLLIFILRSEGESESAHQPEPMSEELPLVAAIKDYLEARAHENVSITDVCLAFGYGKSYLSRIFRAHTGDSICAYATARKIARAKHLIRHGEYNFAEISAMLSFDNPQYFSRVFRRETGMTPTEYKNKARG